MGIKNMFRMTTLVAVLGLLLSLVVAGCGSSGSRDNYNFGGDETKTVTYAYSFPEAKEIATGTTNICYVGYDKDGTMLFNGSAAGGNNFMYAITEEDVAAGTFAVTIKDMPKDTVATMAYFFKDVDEEVTLLGYGLDDVSEDTLIDGDFTAITEDATLTITGVAETAKVGDKLEDLFSAEGVSIKLANGEDTVDLTADMLDYVVTPEGIVGDSGCFEKAGDATIVASFYGIAADPIEVAVGDRALVCVKNTTGNYTVLSETPFYDGEIPTEISEFDSLVLCTVSLGEGGERKFTPIENVEIDYNTFKLDGTAVKPTEALSTDDNGKTFTFDYVVGKELPESYLLEECKIIVEELKAAYLCVYNDDEELELVNDYSFGDGQELKAADLKVTYLDGETYKEITGATVSEFTVGEADPETTHEISTDDNGAELTATYAAVRGYSTAHESATMTVRP